MAEQPKPDFMLQWHLTEKCNLKCKHCYQDAKYLINELTLEEKKKFIDHYNKALKVWKREGIIHFTGGEPLIIKDELFELLKYCNKNYPKLKLGILTNGTLLNFNTAKKLKKHKIRMIQISLDGASKKTHEYIRGKNSYNKALNAIFNINKAGIESAIMFVVHKYNAKEIPKLIDLALKLNVNKLGITRLVPIGSGKQLDNYILSPKEINNLFLYIAKRQVKIKKQGKNLEISTNRPLWCLLREKIKSLSSLGGGCSAGFGGLTLLPNGDVMPCRRLDMTIGNIRNKTLFDIWYSSGILWNLREREKYKANCAKCQHKNYCGGCRAIAKAVKGDYLADDPQCWIKQ